MGNSVPLVYGKRAQINQISGEKNGDMNQVMVRAVVDAGVDLEWSVDVEDLVGVLGSRELDVFEDLLISSLLYLWGGWSFRP